MLHNYKADTQYHQTNANHTNAIYFRANLVKKFIAICGVCSFSWRLFYSVFCFFFDEILVMALSLFHEWTSLYKYRSRKKYTSYSQQQRTIHISKQSHSLAKSCVHFYLLCCAALYLVTIFPRSSYFQCQQF